MTIAVRLRVPLRLKTRKQRLDEAFFGVVLPPVVVPARTTLRVVEFFRETAYALTPDGTGVVVGRTTIRDHGYIPRRPPA